MNVIYIDTRKPWMKREDRYMKCFWKCPLFKYCQSRMGSDCRQFGGTEIPKLRR